MLAPNAARGGINAASLRKRASFHSSASAIGASGVRQGSAWGRAFSTSDRPPARHMSESLLGGPWGSELPPGGGGGAAGSRAFHYTCAPAISSEVHIVQRNVWYPGRVAV